MLKIGNEFKDLIKNELKPIEQNNIGYKFKEENTIPFIRRLFGRKYFIAEVEKGLKEESYRF